jgi:methyltransferase (TIGR00027 family)
MENDLAPIAYTAFRVIFYVALEQYEPEERRLVRDDLARGMLPGRLKLVLAIFRLRPLRQAFFGLVGRAYPGTRGVLCRKCYIDRLVEALETGFDSVVILGAGLDTRAVRIPALSTRPVYEVDLPSTIAYKARKLRQVLGSVPAHIRLVPADLDRQALAGVLNSHGYSPGRTTFFIWEGVTQYLSETAVRTVFEFLARASPGSRIVFTYVVKDFIEGANTYGLFNLYRQTREKQQMWQFGLEPAQVPAFIGEYGWEELEEVGAEDYRERYLDPIGRMDAVMEIERVVYAVRTARQPARIPAPWPPEVAP